MATIVTRSGKGSPLTNNEVDANFTNLNTDKIESGDTVASLTVTSIDINGGTVDGTNIGAASAGTGAFTTLSFSTSISDGTITITGFVDEDDMASDSAALVPTQQSVKAFAQTTADNAAVALAIALG